MYVYAFLTIYIGNKFNVNVVSHFAEAFNFPDVMAAINEATKSGFLVYLGKDEYRFAKSQQLLNAEQLIMYIFY